jgi:uncharacterized membrane protein
LDYTAHCLFNSAQAPLHITCKVVAASKWSLAAAAMAGKQHFTCSPALGRIVANNRIDLKHLQTTAKQPRT